ncbi:O-methyltransferase [Paenibacillus turpanensis]|uniref:O-methyltransferase n=1 Tax=Paenibacillus turpanensis TaxID=2689078 RepID=UPI00313306B3
MLYTIDVKRPNQIDKIRERAAQHGFTASCDDLTGSFLRALAASRKQCAILELGTGVGYSTAWMLDGMDQESKLYSVEMDEACSTLAMEVLGSDPRLQLIVEDGGKYIEEHKNAKFDLIFADTWPGKFYLIEEVLNMVKPGGIYLIDDLNPQENWPEGHESKVAELITELEAREDFYICKMNWSTGLMMLTKKH